MQPAMPATNTDLPLRAERGQPMRRTAVGSEMHRVLIRIPDFRDPAPLATPQPITTLPLSHQVQTFVVHQAHSALQPHVGRGKPRGAQSTPDTGPATIIAAPPVANLPPISASHNTPPVVDSPSTTRALHNNTPVNTAAIDAVVGTDYDTDDDHEEAVDGATGDRTSRPSRAPSKLAAVGRWVSDLDADDLQRIRRKLTVLATIWMWMQQPRIMIGAIGVLLLQFTGLAVLLEWNSPSPNAPPGPKSSLAPAASSPLNAIQTPLNSGPTSGLVQPGVLPQSTQVPPQSPRGNPLPEGPLTPTLAPPISKPIQTPLNSSLPAPQSSAPRFNSTPRLGDEKNVPPWITSPTASEQPTITPVAPETSASRQSPAGSVGKRPTRPKVLNGTIETPQQENPR